jgi:hypothetical protein
MSLLYSGLDVFFLFEDRARKFNMALCSLNFHNCPSNSRGEVGCSLLNNYSLKYTEYVELKIWRHLLDDLTNKPSLLPLMVISGGIIAAAYKRRKHGYHYPWLVMSRGIITAQRDHYSSEGSLQLSSITVICDLFSNNSYRSINQ